jgi:hypothetical protein
VHAWRRHTVCNRSLLSYFFGRMQWHLINIKFLSVICDGLSVPFVTNITLFHENELLTAKFSLYFILAKLSRNSV